MSEQNQILQDEYVDIKTFLKDVAAGEIRVKTKDGIYYKIAQVDPKNIAISIGVTDNGMPEGDGNVFDFGKITHSIDTWDSFGLPLTTSRFIITETGTFEEAWSAIGDEEALVIGWDKLPDPPEPLIEPTFTEEDTSGMINKNEEEYPV